MEFTREALICCMGGGALSLQGQKQRPWLTLRRSEVQRSRLDGQVRRLRRVHDGPMEAVWDQLPTQGFYDEVRVRLQGEGLYRVYELLYPRDELTWRRPMLEIAGLRGYAAWLEERGQRRQGRLSLRGPVQQGDYQEVVEHLKSLGFEANPRWVNGVARGVELDSKSAVAFTELLKPWRRLKCAA